MLKYCALVERMFYGFPTLQSDLIYCEIIGYSFLICFSSSMILFLEKITN